MAEPDLHTLAEVADCIRKPSRWLRDYLRKRPFGRRVGRDILFTDADVLSLIGSFELVGDGHQAYAAATRSTKALAHTSDATLREALALALEKRPSKLKGRP